MATILSAINKRFDMLESQAQRSKVQGVHSVHMTPIVCDQCEDVHLPDHCPLYMASASVNYMGKFQNPNNNPYSNTYNPGWMNHPNFKWSQGQAVNPSSSSGVNPSHPPGFQSQTRRIPQKEEDPKMDRMEKMLSQILAGQEAARIQNDARLAGHDASIKNLEIQMGQLASQLNVMATHISKGSLPSDTIPNQGDHSKEWITN